MSQLAWICLFVVAVSAAPKKPTKVEIKCEDRPDGTYTVGCSQTFTQCYKKIAYQKFCPADLYFNHMYGRCDFKLAVKECKDAKKYEGKILQQPEPFSCLNRTDGSYSHPEIPCDQIYYTCNHHYSTQMSCPYNQFFDQENNRCEYKERVPACRNKKISGTIDAPEGPVVYGAVIQEVAEPAAPAPPTPSPDAVQVIITDKDNRPDCKTAGDGVYAAIGNACSNFFWKCANDVAFKYQCQKDLFYDTEAMRCDHQEFVPNCGGTRQITTPMSVYDPIDFDCSGKEDGNYVKEPCSTIFYNCNSEVARELKCDAGLHFDTRVDYCDYPEMCRNERTTVEPVTGNQVDLDEPKTTEAPIDFDCSQKKDGIYALGHCQSKHVQCSSGSAFAMNCPSDLVFDDVSKMCGYLETCKNPVTTTSAPGAPVTETSTTAEVPTTTTTTAGPPAQAPEEAAPAYGAVTEEEATTTTTTTTTSTTTTTPTPTTATTTTFAPIAYGAQEVVTSQENDNTVTEVAPVAEITCANLANGAHATEPCGTKYVNCWEGVAHRMQCQHGLFFNPYDRSCDYKENINDCVPGGKVKFTKTTTAAPAFDAPVTTTAKPQPVDEFCKDKETGFHGHGCSAYFYSCSNGITHKMVCPSGQYFDAESTHCIEKENIVACGASPKITPEAATTTTPVIATVAPTAAPTPVVAQEIVVDTFCKDKQTGFFGDGCKDYFYSCNAGNTYKFPCPGELFYDEVMNGCAHKETIVACGATTTTAATVAVDVGGNTPATPAKPETFCEDLADGFYGYHCNEYFYSCNGGATTKMTCPTGLFYDIEKNRCNMKDNVVACGATPSPTTVAVPEPTTVKPVPAYNSIVPVRPETKPQKPQVTFDCSNKKDGLFALEECTPIFIQCYNGQMIQQECQPGLFYNVDNGMCDYAEKVKVCGASVAATVPAVEATTTTTIATPTAHVAAEPSTLPANATCSGKSDGFYSNGCSANYYACIDKNPIPMKCGDMNLRFDVARTLCDYPLAVAECGGSAPTTAEPAAQAPEVAGAQPTKPTFTCTGKTDGFYAIAPCSSFYARCVSDSPYVQKCPRRLIFNEEGQSCDYKENLAGCKPVDATVPTVAPTASASTAAPVVQTTAAPPAPPPTNLPAREAPTFCTGKADGAYPLGDCSPEFIICRNGAAQSGRCNNNLVFNSVRNYCDLAQRVTSCNIATQPPAVLPPFPNHPIAPVGPYSAPVRQQPQATFSCIGKNDGLYGASCTTGFIRCAAQRAYSYTCPSGTVYNGNVGRCDTVANTRC